ncbi:MAG: hypothetical protein J5804_06600, partial [Eggerthellaceae bacterium]|nr:hypothetical protein [Eggerthellaceae bacterium]
RWNSVKRKRQWRFRRNSPDRACEGGDEHERSECGSPVTRSSLLTPFYERRFFASYDQTLRSNLMAR